MTAVAANLVWADLPRTAGGFEEHYRGYGDGFRAPDPRLAPAYLTAEGWKPLGEEPVAMVRRSAPNGPLLAQRRVRGARCRAGRWRRAPASPRTTSASATASAPGCLSLTLDCPGEAFGHAAYPGALAHAMRPAYVPSARRPIPPAPWTPQVAAHHASTTAARAAITLDAPQAAQPGERVAQIGPFGVQEIFPARGRPGAGLFPARLADGALFVRIEGAEATGPVSLLFEMEAGSHQRTAFQPDGGRLALPDRHRLAAAAELEPRSRIRPTG